MNQARGDSDGETTAEGESKRLVSFAEMVARVTASFLDEQGADPRAALTEQLVAGAVAVIPGVTGAAIEVVGADGRLGAPVSVGDAVLRVMEAQNDTGEGPCLGAWHHDVQTVTEDLRVDPRWPDFAPRAVDAGVTAMVSTPIEVGGRRLAILSLVGTCLNTDPDEGTAVLARVFALHAAVLMTSAHRVHELYSALTSRDVIGQAKGILMERFKVTPEVAFALLVRTSTTSNVKLRVVAEELCRTGSLPEVSNSSRNRS